MWVIKGTRLVLEDTPNVSANLTDINEVSISKRCPQLNTETKAKVLELLDVGVTKPRLILRQLEFCNLPIISRVQINNLKQRLHTKTSGPLTYTLSQFLQWVKVREDVPDNDDQVYVVDYDYKLSKSKTNKIKDLRCFLTTRRLVKHALKSKILIGQWLID